MKSSKKNNEPHILLFWSLPSISMLEVYKEKCKKLNYAITRMKSLEITTRRNKILKLKKIGVESGRFYGFTSFEGKMKKTLLNVNDIKTIELL